MEQSVKTAPKAKKLKGWKIAVIVVAAVILVPLLAAGGLLIYLAGVDVGAEPPEEETMTIEQRIGANADDETLTVRMNESDIFFILEESGLMAQLTATGDKSPLASVNGDIKEVGISFKNGITVSANASVYGLRAPVKADIALDASGDSVGVILENAYLGNLKAPASILQKLGVAVGSTVYSIEKKGLMSAVKDISIENGTLNFTVDVSSGLLTDGFPQDNVERAGELLMYCGDIPAAGVVIDSVAEDAENTGEPLRAALASIEEDPNKLIELSNSILALADEDTKLLFTDESTLPYIERFLPGVSAEAADALRESYGSMAAYRKGELEQLVRNIRNAYKDKKLSTDTHKFYNLDMDGLPLKLMQMTDDWMPLKDFLNLAESRVIFAQNGPMVLDLPYYSEIPRTGDATDLSNSYFAGSFLRFAVVLITRMPGGAPAVLYIDTNDEFAVRVMSERTFTEYLSAERIPVYGMN